MVHNTVLDLESNLNDLNDIDNYQIMHMFGCIFVSTENKYYEACKRCGLDENNERVHEILFDLNTRFLISKVKPHNHHINEEYYVNDINKILSDGVYPGEFEIECDNYNIIYSSDNYFELVNDIINNDLHFLDDDSDNDSDDDSDNDQIYRVLHLNSDDNLDDNLDSNSDDYLDDNVDIDYQEDYQNGDNLNSNSDDYFDDYQDDYESDDYNDDYNQ